jgi:hypothetical protein
MLVTAVVFGSLGTLCLRGFRSLSGCSQFMQFAAHGPRYFPRYESQQICRSDWRR